MATFNQKARDNSITENHAGDKAYSLSKEMELYSLVVTSFVANKFYESGDMRLKRLRSLVADISKTNPEFVAKLAVYAREKMHLRSIPLVLAVELSKVHSGDSLVSKMIYRIIQRADEITEALGYYALANEREDVKKLGRLSKQIRLGIAKAFTKFDEYQFAKYNRDTEIKFRDALFLTHPKAVDVEQQKLFDKIVSNTLEVPYTWEVELSSGRDKKEVWEEMIDSGNLGYMAMLRNLRNMLKADVSLEHLEKVAKRLSDKEEVLHSKQLPFRFLSAHKELSEHFSKYTSLLLDSLEEAVIYSVDLLKGFDFDTSVLVACDVSGSMSSQVSSRSRIQMYDIGLLLGMLLHYKSKAVVSGIFGDRWKTISLPKTGVLSNTDKLRGRMGEVGYSTNGFLVIKDLLDREEKIDKIMMFTDCQMWNSGGAWEDAPKGEFERLWKEYKKISPNSKLYLFDLAGYGTIPVSVKQGDVYLISGWSDKVFTMLDAYENGSTALKEIEKIEL